MSYFLLPLGVVDLGDLGGGVRERTSNASASFNSWVACRFIARASTDPLPPSLAMASLVSSSLKWVLTGVPALVGVVARFARKRGDGDRPWLSLIKFTCGFVSIDSRTNRLP